jgi:glucan phosphoethanolaminetransferase (alkaline phosphatase superfamily)
MDFLKLKLVEYGMAFVIAPLAVLVVQWLKKYSVWVEKQGPWMKRSFVAVTVFVFAVLAQVTGVDFGVTTEESLTFLANIDHTTIETLLGTATAFLLHALKKAAKK